MTVSDLIIWLVLIDLLEKLQTLAAIISICLGTGFLFTFVFKTLEGDSLKDIPAIKPLSLVFILSLSIAIIIPGNNTLYTVAALKAGDSVIQQLEDSKYTSKLKSILDAKFDAIAEDVKR